MKRLFLAALLALAPLARADDAVWAQLKAGGNVLLIRHAATEPGLGDPPNFFLGDCRTQRNLSEAGREEARRVGRALKWRAVAVSEVRASQWCRTLETAELAFGHPPVPWEALNSLHKDPDREAERTRAVAALIATVRPPQNVALVTHNFNIRALTGVSPSTAEIIVVRGEGGKVVVVGRLPAP
ncbi:MAG: histidine phosphatase family protein [Denitratisoma sp.]|nr:histidine phosphatase family protein [Denitratisoma sp.]